MKIAIIGAGVSGLSAAYFLLEKNPDAEIEIFEKSSEIGGRVSTQGILGKGEVDTGCQYLSIDDPEVLDFLFKVSPKESIRSLPGPILCLPECWVIETENRYYFPRGMVDWPRELARVIQNKSPKFKLNFGSDVRDLNKIWAQGFEHILVSAPGARAKSLGARRTCDYWPCLGIVFSWNHPPREASEYYAFRDLEFREGTIWLAHDGLKRGSPELWIAQLSPSASEVWKGKNFEELEDLLQTDLENWFPAFAKGDKTVLDSKYWEQAFPAMSPDPTEQHPFERVDLAGNRRVYYFGDGYLGVGRAENAVQSAIAVARDF